MEKRSCRPYGAVAGNSRKRHASLPDHNTVEAMIWGKRQRTVGDKTKPFESQVEDGAASRSSDQTEVASPGASPTTDGTRYTSKHLSTLQIPNIEDSLYELASMLAAITRVLRAGKSISEATSYLAASTLNGEA